MNKLKRPQKLEQYEMYTLCVYCSLRQQVPMVFSLHLVYLSTVACISEEINSGPLKDKISKNIMAYRVDKNKILHIGCINSQN